MKREIEEFKQKNGGTIEYSIKELIGALHVKVDKLGDRFADHCTDSSECIGKMKNKATKHDVLLGLLYVILTGLLLKTIIG